MTEDLDIVCPRCGKPARVRFWGPCGECREDLGRRLQQEARAVEAAPFEPAMHVVPNQVATKE
jgi:hypothetical protein